MFSLNCCLLLVGFRSVLIINGAQYSEYNSTGTANNVTENQYFIFNESGFHLEHHIVCNAGVNCHVSCIGDDICHNLVLTSQGTLQFLTINAESANNLHLECIGQESCARINVIPPRKGNVHIKCNKNTADINGLGACIWIKVYGNATRNVTVHCEMMKDCYAISIDIFSANHVNIDFAAPQSGYNAYLSVTNVSHSLHVVCNGSESCTNSNLFCAPGALCSVECITETSCAAMAYYIPSKTYDQLRISCVDYDKNHCFWLNDTRVSIHVSYSADIHCQDTEQSSPLIYNAYSHELSCHDRCCPFDVQELTMQDCVDTPITPGSCVVDCATTFCDGKIIDGESKDSLTVICRENGNAYSNCNGLHVFCPLHGTCLIQCDIHLGCKDLTVQNNAHVVLDAHVVVLCSKDTSCGHINLTAPNAYSVAINASASHSLLGGEIHVENVRKFELFCYNKDGEYYAFQACAHNRLFVADHVDSLVDVTCKGQSCGDLHFYVSDGWRATGNMNLNIISMCQCGGGGIYWSECMSFIGIFCAQHGNIPYAEFNDIKDGNCSDLCGCHHLVQNIHNRYIDDDLKTNECDDDSSDYHIVNTNRVMVTTVSGMETLTNEKRMGTATRIGIVVSVVLLCGIILFLWTYIYRKRQKQIRGIHVRQQSCAERDNDDDESDMNQDTLRFNDETLLHS